MKLQLMLAQQKEEVEKPSLYTIVAAAPGKSESVKLYLAPVGLFLAPNDYDLLPISEAPTLDEAVSRLFQAAIDLQDETERDKPDFLGWPVYFMSVGMVEAGGGDFFGWEPFSLYPIPQEALLKFAQLYAARVKEAKSQFHRK